MIDRATNVLLCPFAQLVVRRVEKRSAEVLRTRLLSEAYALACAREGGYPFCYVDIHLPLRAMNSLPSLDCDDTFYARVRALLLAFPCERASSNSGRAAAVAVAIADEGFGAELAGLPRHAIWQSRAALLLTRRALTLRNHAGQWAFPGGRFDDGETAEETALREMREEIGLDLAPTAIIGRLDDFTTRSGYVITPVVIWAGAQAAFTPNAHEVASIHRIPVAELLRGDAPLLDPGPDEGRPVLRMPIGDDWIAAPTAAILYQFREVCVLGRPTRVGHYDQPAFAWR